MTENAAAAAARIAYWRDNPVEFVKDEFGVTPDPWQGDVVAAYPDAERLAMLACVGPGKTAVLAWIILNFMATRPLPKVAATSITWPNLRDNLWAELAKWISTSELLDAILTWTQTRIIFNERPEQSWVSARTWDRSADTEALGKTLSGLHADYVMAVADETGGMPLAVVQATEGIFSGKPIEAHVLQAGNPTHFGHALYEATENGGGLWTTFRVHGDPRRDDCAPRVSRTWAEDLIRRYGYESAFVRSKVRGLFPLQATDALVGLNHFEDAFGRTHAYDDHELKRGIRVVGVDVARFGADSTVVVKRDGDFIDDIVEWAGKDLVESSNRVAMIMKDYNAVVASVDDIGLGGGVVDNLRDRTRRGGDLTGRRVVGVNVGIASKVKDERDQPKYSNKKAELNFAAAEKLIAGEVSITPKLRDSAIVGQGTDIRYSFAPGGKTLRIEDKDDFKKRHNGVSPDHWDAFVLAITADARRPGRMTQGWG